MKLEQKYLSLLGSAGPDHGADLRICFEILSLAARIDRDCAARLAPYGLSESKFLLLSLLNERDDGAPPHTLADLAGVTRATMTGLLDGMARDGLLTRAHDLHDRRKIVVRLTPKGTSLAAELGETHRRWIGSIGAGLTADERAVLSGLLGRLRANLRGDDNDHSLQEEAENGALSD